LTFTGRIDSGSEGSDLGLITRTAPDPLSAAMELAGGIAHHSPDAIRAAKRLYNETWISNDPAAACAHRIGESNASWAVESSRWPTRDGDVAPKRCTAAPAAIQ
jgi:enoyl-CoA hydratase/carnithine racemase